MTRPLVKICGVCRPQDAALAADAGADYVGVVLVPGRPRGRTLPEAEEILAAAGNARRVGVFADAAEAEVLRAAEVLRLDVVQLHGSERPVEVMRLRDLGAPPIWKAAAAGTAAAARWAVEAYGPVAAGILLDGGGGGWGVVFDWHAVGPLRDRLPPGVVLAVAGGLEPGNVARAIACLDPDVVDVSSGVEEAPGRKSEAGVRAFVAAARAAGTGA